MEKNFEQKLKLIEKAVVNVGVGRKSQEANFENKILPEIEKTLSAITGQKPVICPARKSIAGFKIRAGQIVGLKVTLRGKRMKDFIFKIINLALPRVKDFKGISAKNIDEGGNLNLGFRDCAVFPEVVLEKLNVPFGLEITIVPKKGFQSKEKAIDFYKSLGIPFRLK